MTRTRSFKTNFTAGEISPRLLARGDLTAYQNGASRLRNVFIHPTGGVSRRAGLAWVGEAEGDGRLIAFEFNTEQVYLLAVSDSQIDVWKDGIRQTSLATPWTAAQIRQLAWTQSADTLLVCHPDVSPKRITRTGHTAWTVADWSFIEEETKDEAEVVLGTAHRVPFHKFADDDVTLTPSGTVKDSSITVTASAAAFDVAHVGLRFRIAKRQVEITAVASATSATATVKETLLSTDGTKDWEEPAFSAFRGWPVSVTFHQDRLVIGGARDLPNRLWLSKSAELFNFDLGEGLDDEAIEFAILSDQVNAVRGVFSGRHLQVFTSGAEWMVTGDPLTPGNVQLKRQTRIGSPVDRMVPPRDVDGATLFAGRNGVDLREFLFADVEQAYQANDLALLARHLMNAPVDMDYDSTRRIFFAAMADGSLASVTIFRTEEVTGWTGHDVEGDAVSVAVADTDVYLLIARNGEHHILRLDDGLSVDWGLSASSATPTAVWTGFDHLEGETLTVVADGAVHPDVPVAAGSITLEVAASEIQAGLPFGHEIEPLPPTARSPIGSGEGVPVRLIRATFRLLETGALRIDCGRGFRDVPFKKLGAASVLDTGPTNFTGDVGIRAIGWRRDGVSPLWRIGQSTPLPCTLLGVNTEIKIND